MSEPTFDSAPRTIRKVCKNALGPEHRDEVLEVAKTEREKRDALFQPPRSVEEFIACIAVLYKTKGDIPVVYEIALLESITAELRRDPTLRKVFFEFDHAEPDTEYMRTLGIPSSKVDKIGHGFTANVLRPEEDTPPQILLLIERILANQIATYEEKKKDFFENVLPELKASAREKALAAIGRGELNVPIEHVDFLLNTIPVRYHDSMSQSLRGGGQAHWTIRAATLNLSDSFSSREELTDLFDHEFLHALSRHVVEIVTKPGEPPYNQPRRIGLEFTDVPQEGKEVTKYSWLNEAAVELVRVNYFNPGVGAPMYKGSCQLTRTLIDKVPGLSLPLLRDALTDWDNGEQGHMWEVFESAIVNAFGQNMLNDIDATVKTKGVAAAIQFVEAL